MSCRCLKPRWFVGDPISLARDNMLMVLNALNLCYLVCESGHLESESRHLKSESRQLRIHLYPNPNPAEKALNPDLNPNPDSHITDAYHIIVPLNMLKWKLFQIWKRFTEFNMKRPSLNYNLAESDILDLTEEVCDNDKTWERYIHLHILER